MKSISSSNFKLQLQSRETPRQGCLSRFVRWFLTPKVCIINDFETYLAHVDSRDLPFALFYACITLFIRFLQLCKFDGHWKSDFNMEQSLCIWDTKRGMKLQKYQLLNSHEFMSFEGLSWFFNTSAELLTQLKRQPNNGIFYIDTTFMDQYEHKPQMRKLGSRGEFMLIDGLLSLQKVYYNNAIYAKCDHSEEAQLALRAFYGSYSLIRTILTHAIGIHWKSSAETILQFRKVFPVTHPLRQVMLPTEFGAMNGLGRAGKTLLDRDAFFHTLSPFTYEGLCLFMEDFIADQKNSYETNIVYKNGLSEYKEWNLTPEEITALPFHGLDKWSRHIYSSCEAFMVAFCREFPGDKQYLQWLSLQEETNQIGDFVKVLGGLYMLQVLHSTVANSDLFYIFSTYSYTMQTNMPDKLMKSQNLISTHFMQMIIDESTAQEWFHLDLDLSNLIDNKECCKVWSKFYSGMNAWHIDTRISSYQPNHVPGSTGL